MAQKIRFAVLIDDEEIDRRQYQRVLKKSGLVDELKTFIYADDALAFLKDNPQIDVDVIFLDINIPRMNGFDFLAAATAQLGPEFARIVVAMLTTSLNPDDYARAQSYEVVKEFINKPLTNEHVSRIARLLGS
ncbi:MAG: response regulator [Pseudomonadota bacterium]